MREHLAMRTAAVAAVTVLALVGAGCEPDGRLQAALDELERRMASLEGAVPHRFGPASQTTAHITLFCDPEEEDTCDRSLSILPMHQICFPAEGHECPTEVLWQVVGAGSCWRPDDQIEIEEKSWQDSCFPTASMVITGPPFQVTSGQALEPCQPRPSGFTTWYYDVRLVNPACPEAVDSVDPVVIIEPT